MKVHKWVFIDKTRSAATKDGSKLSTKALKHVAEAVRSQVNLEFASEWGTHIQIRIGTRADDWREDEFSFFFVGQLPDDPDASAYHDLLKHGVPFAICAVSSCKNLFGPNGVSVDVSHEILETAGDAGANLYANNNKGYLHAMEMCDAVEVQTYRKTCRDGTVVHVSNWLLRAWFVPHAKGPYDYMTSKKLPGAVSPPGPMRTAPGKGGNYQIVSRWNGSRESSAIKNHIRGKRRKGNMLHWSSRTGRRMRKLLNRKSFRSLYLK